MPPIEQLGYKYDREEFGMSLRWWLGFHIYEEGAVCPEPKCSAVMDQHGDHAVMCQCGPSRNARHDNTNYSWCFALKGFGFECKREVFTDPSSRHRSADTLVSNWRFGRSCAHDWVITHVLQEGAFSSMDPNWALRHVESSKNSWSRDRCRTRGIDFIPMAMDTFGGLGAEAEAAFEIAVARGKLHRGAAGEFDMGVSVKALKQRLRVSVMKGVARQLLRRIDVAESTFDLPVSELDEMEP